MKQIIRRKLDLIAQTYLPPFDAEMPNELKKDKKLSKPKGPGFYGYPEEFAIL